MTKQEVAILLVQVINEQPGIRVMELVVHEQIIHHLKNLNSSGIDLYDVLEDLVVEQRIAVMEFATPNMSYRIKTLYFPENTVLHRSENFCKP